MITGRDRLPELLAGLDPVFGEKLLELLDTLEQGGLVVRPYSGSRSPLEQAVLWCQSRTPLECELMARKLHDERAEFLARVIRRATLICTPGRWATNNLPGQSWHNFGLAVDAHVVSEDGRAVWGVKHPSYERYAEEALKLGLCPGFYQPRQDVVHIQALAKTVRSVKGTWEEVDQELRQRFPREDQL